MKPWVERSLGCVHEGELGKWRREEQNSRNVTPKNSSRETAKY